MARTSAMGLSSSGSSVDMSAFATTGPVFERELSSRSTEQSPDEAFFEEDLVWPDPTNRFEKVSGIKPAILSAELKHLHGGYRPKDVCEQALEVRKRPRPREVPWNVVIIKSDPPDLDHIDDLEEFLVHDNMFVEFFNAFLSLPTFAEAVRFNVDTGGFEVVSDDKRKLAQQIKEAVRSQNTTANMYKVARQHAFSDIPIVPIEDEGASEKVKLKTTFPVIMLNKEQGMQWVKAQRVPVFVRSDCYYQYRLAKVISQARLFNEHGEYVVMKIDYMNRSKTKHRSVPKPPPSEEEIIVKEMYISFGDMKGAAKEAWFTHAKEQLRAETTSTTLSPRVSSSVKKRSKNAVFKSAYFGVYNPGKLLQQILTIL